jgi:(S)-2-hydroxyglutarate dehydrogenase
VAAVSDQTVGIVGGGIVGLAVARELVRRRPGTRLVVFEKEDRVAAHQTGHNSGVVHAGIYYKPGSLKAQLSTRGRHLLRDYCAERNLPYDECGKLVVAVDPSELGRFDALEKTARENGVTGLRRVEAAEIVEIEPHAAGLVALHSPATAITDYVAIAQSFADEVAEAGGELRLSTPVTGIDRTVGGVAIASGTARHLVDRVVVCAGLQADRVSGWIDGEDGPRIVPFRGEYMAVKEAKAGLVRGMVYPVPDPRYPFLGVHFTRRVSGALEVGPNAVLALGREAYRRRSEVVMGDVRSMVTWPGFWRMARTHWRTGVREVRGSLSVRVYMREAQRYVPEIGAADVVRGGSGIRAQAVDRDGSLVDDFRITESDGVLCVRNAPSPAATSSLAIAEHVAARVR